MPPIRASFDVGDADETETGSPAGDAVVAFAVTFVANAPSLVVVAKRVVSDADVIVVVIAVVPSQTQIAGAVVQSSALLSLNVNWR